MIRLYARNPMRPPRRRRSDSFKDFVLDQLSAMPDLTGRAMFGGYGLYFQGRFFAIIHKGRLFFKTHDLTQPFYRSRGMQPFRPHSRHTLARYYEVPLEILEDPQDLAAWARHAAVPPSAQLLLPFATLCGDTVSYGELSAIAGPAAFLS
jgi:DNA transformation protein and related proteins